MIGLSSNCLAYPDTNTSSEVVQQSLAHSVYRPSPHGIYLFFLSLVIGRIFCLGWFFSCSRFIATIEYLVIAALHPYLSRIFSYIPVALKAAPAHIVWTLTVLPPAFPSTSSKSRSSHCIQSHLNSSTFHTTDQKSFFSSCNICTTRPSLY